MFAKQYSLWPLSAGVIAAALCFGLGYIVGVRAEIASVPSQLRGITGADRVAPEGVDLSPVWKAWNVLDEKFVVGNQVSTGTPTTTAEEARQNRVWGMIAGMAASLGDPYTFFLPPTDAKEFQEDINGAFEGVGMQVDVKNEVLTIVSPLKESPAERAGLKAGDMILEIDGRTTKGLDVSSAVKLIRGPKGTQVELKILREGKAEPFTVKVTRDVINLPIVTSTKRDDGIFMIRLDTFTATSPELFRKALREFVESGDTKLILDLRGNPGGYLEAAVDMGSWFLPAGKPIVTEDYGGNQPSVVHRSRGYDIFNKNLKMVILVDRGSASASEILAAALRHYGVAQLVGTATFGKGSVQELVPITSTTSLKVTVARWLTPGGKQIPITGIVPDVEVTLTEKDVQDKNDLQLKKAIEILHK